ncbi:MAG: hypothetical protein ABR532_00120 [Candidatus Dormibacteria bacterium]
MAAVLALAAVLTLGPPDWHGAWGFLAGGGAGTSGAVAVAAILCWVVMAVTVAAASLACVRAVRIPAVARSPATLATACLVIGVVLLLLGALHHTSARYTMCCGSSVEHDREARRLVE